MSLFNASNELSNVNLTPFKYVMCSLINIFSFKKNYINSIALVVPIKTQFFIFYESINTLITSFTNENTKSSLIASSKSTISLIAKKYDVNTNTITELQDYFIQQINMNLSMVKNINDLHSFFKVQIQNLIIKTPQNFEGEKIIVFHSGGHIHNYLRKCLSSFNRLSFLNLLKLYEDIIKYNNNEKINIILSTKESDKLFDECFSSINNSQNYLTFDNFSQKVLFTQNANSKLTEKLFNIHKFYDYNLRYIYNDNLTANETKIHYSLLYLTNLYYESGYYDKAIQILFECVKLSQSNCDHEALLKCFLWLSKIFIQIGNFDLASQCLSTCLIKSFQNNFQLLYFLSSIELSNLNFVFNSNIGINAVDSEELSQAKAKTLEEKILSHSNNYLHLYKNISDFYTMKDKEIKDDLNTMITYMNNHLIFNLIHKGEHSLAIEYLKISLKEVLPLLNDHLTETNKEIINSVLSLMMNIMEFDYNFAIGIIFEIISKYKDTDFFCDYLLWSIVNKYFSECQAFTNMKPFDDKDRTIGIYYQFVNEYYIIYHLLNESDLIQQSDIEDILLDYIKRCKEKHIFSYRTKSLILLCKLYIKEKRMSETQMILNKIINNQMSSIYQKIISKITLCYCYFSSQLNSDKAITILKDIKIKVDSICSIADKYDYYYICSLFFNEEDFVIKCIQYSILLNNENKISAALKLLDKVNKRGIKENYEKKIAKLKNKNEKLIEVINRFKTTPKEAIEVIYLINTNNYEY